MSRIGKQPVTVPGGVNVELKNSKLKVKGPKGELELDIHPDMDVVVGEGIITVNRPGNDRRLRSLHGLTRALIANHIAGVSKGFEKDLEIHGTGYNAAVKGNKLVLTIGFCHPVEIEIAKGLEVKAEKGKPIKIKVSGIDKQAVGQLAAQIRAVRPPDPYKQKGIRYKGEVVEKKEGKAFGKK